VDAASFVALLAQPAAKRSPITALAKRDFGRLVFMENGSFVSAAGRLVRRLLRT